MGVCFDVKIENKCFCFGKRKRKGGDKESSKNSDIKVEGGDGDGQSIDVGLQDSQISSHKVKLNTALTEISKTIGINNQKLKDFLKNMIYQSFLEETNDLPFNEFIKIEIEELKKEVEKLSEDLISWTNKELKFKDIKKDIIANIIEKELTNSMLKRKISSMVNEYERDANKYNIPYLKVILVGRKDIGQTDLINFMLELEPNKNENKNKKLDLKEYISDKVPYLRLIEYKGIGFDQDSNPELIGNNLYTYIQNLQKRKNKDYIHCIWYCITETKFEDPEIAVLKKLKTAYKNDNVLPVIAVYTKTESDDIANKMEEHIRTQGIDTIFIKTLAKRFTRQNGTIAEAFGREELLKATLEKCTSSLQGDLINLMTNNISEEIQNELKENNKKLLSKIHESIISKFVSEYNQVLEDGDLINYIINAIIENIKQFTEGQVSNRCFNILNNSEFIKEVKSMVKAYKEKVKKLIESTIENKAKKFLNLQAKIEIERGNMEIKNKKKLKELKRVIEIYMKKNLYYISQRIMITYIIEKIYVNFFKELKTQLDKKIGSILNINNNHDIKLLLEHIFLRKLKDFGDRWGINIRMKDFENDVFDFPDKMEIERDDEKQNNNNLNTGSIVFINNDDHTEEKIEDKGLNNKPLEDNNDWFPSNKRKNWKFIKEKTIILENYLQSLEIQDTFFIKKTNDQIFSNFKEYMKNDLIIFLNKKKSEFITNIDKSYQNKQIPFEDKIIPKIFENENISSIYDKLIETEINELNNNLGLITIDYITILVVGRSGIGKSILISAMTDHPAPNGVGFRVTLNNDFYRGINNKHFLQMIDTRGTELDQKVGLPQIIKNVNEMIDSQKIKGKNNYNENIQCIYYCVKGSSLEDAEIDAIKAIKNNKEKIPVIIVYTMGINRDDYESMENQLKPRLNLPFINILTEKMGCQESYGLNDLLKLTLDECKKSVKGNVFKAIKKKLSDIVISKLKQININIKLSVNNNMAEKLINFKKVVSGNDFYNLIYQFIEIAFIEHIKIDDDNNIIQLKEESNNEFQQLKALNDFIKEYIKHYQNESSSIIKPTLENGSLEFLDQQVKLEKKLSKSIERENKNTRESLKEIIKSFLESNFDYIGQKYLLYKLLHDFSEPFSEVIEKKVNEIVVQNLEKNKAIELLKKSYSIIFKAFVEEIYKNSRNGMIFEEGNNKNENNNNYEANNYNGSTSQIKENNLECPYPPFKNN